ncbi:zinc finger protein 37-like [Phlebotomus papatasi]|uniref:zinc finger protein 37-like n=1 Tax=Phlebotomus papatasi TaxID=29031 RepID=UPI0024843295|nr:zinc finger protein 37-like [Phlebotomus papatasi]
MEIRQNPLIQCNFIRNLCKRIAEIHSEVIQHESTMPKCEICSENITEYFSIKNQLFLILRINIQIKDEGNSVEIHNENKVGSQGNDSGNRPQSDSIKEEAEESIEDTSNFSTNFVAVADYLDCGIGSSKIKEDDTKSSKQSKEMDVNADKLYECALCKIKVSKKCHLVLHMKKHLRKAEKKRNYRGARKNIAEGISKSEEDGKKKCPFCSRIYKRRHDCSNNEPKVGNTYSCAYCPETFSTYPKIYFHHKAHHSDKPKPLSPFQCEVCGKFTVQLSALRHHMKTHTGFTPFECSTCQKRFRTRHQLTEHLRKHIPKSERDDKYKCYVCQKKFTFRQSLKKHERLQHSGTIRKSFICTICGWKFICDTSLQKHLTIHDGETIPSYKCDDCGRVFEKLKYLNQHRKIQHNVFTDLMLNRKLKKKE